MLVEMDIKISEMFQHTAARRRLGSSAGSGKVSRGFQHTAARRRLVFLFILRFLVFRFQHTAARRRLEGYQGNPEWDKLFQHTAARRRLALPSPYGIRRVSFQHTAARRRLAPSANAACADSGFNTQPPEGGWATCMALQRVFGTVSTHSRPKAAGSVVS